MNIYVLLELYGVVFFFNNLVTYADLLGNLSLYKGLLLNLISTLLQKLSCLIILIFINIIPLRILTTKVYPLFLLIIESHKQTQLQLNSSVFVVFHPTMLSCIFYWK